MPKALAFAAQDAVKPLGQTSIERREPGRGMCSSRFFFAACAIPTFTPLAVSGRERFTRACRGMKSSGG